MADRQRVLMVVMIMAAVMITASDGAGNCCSDCIQCPGLHGSCILNSDLCNDVEDCQHGEDENKHFCEIYSEESCSKGQISCNRRGCISWKDACDLTNYYISSCLDKLASGICEILTEGQLPSFLTPSLEPPQFNVDMKRVSEYLLAGNCSQADDHNTTKCPMLYTDVAGTCLAALPFELSWTAAHQVCQSIAGKLLEFKDVHYFIEIVQHLINTDLSSDFWIGGFFNQDENDWAWSSGGLMPFSTPYWTLKYNSTCQSRKSSNSLGPVPGCFHYQQAPLTFRAGHCAALPYRYLYYISDEPCFENKRPLCVAQINEN